MAKLLGGILLISWALWPQNVSAQLPEAMDHSIWYPVRKVYQSAIFQGSSRRSNYFEGWYFKLVAPGGAHIYSLIPGIAFGEKGSAAHAFIQVINGKTAETSYHSFPADAFRYSRKRFEVAIGNNKFSREGIQVDFGEGAERFQADLKFAEVKPLRSRLIWPGIMGWYRFAPFMETYHGLVSMDHSLQGTLQVNQQSISFDGGRGYIEKDWGHTFPQSWIWMQTNHFAEAGTSFMCSIARVPWLGKAFQGFLGFLLVDGEVYRFATYTGAQLEDLEMNAATVSFAIQARKFRIEVEAERSKTGLLQAPVAGSMDRRIAESVDAVVKIRLLDQARKLIYAGTGKNAGLEVVGDTRETKTK